MVKLILRGGRAPQRPPPGSAPGYRRRRPWVQMDQSPRNWAAVIGREDARSRFDLLGSNCCKTSEGALRLPARTAERELRVFRWAGEAQSHHCTMGPQPDLARHQRFRRLVANGVKCMSNYSELSTYHEYGNIFSISCTVFALQEPEVRTLKQSLETRLRLAKSVD